MLYLFKQLGSAELLVYHCGNRLWLISLFQNYRIIKGIIGGLVNNMGFTFKLACLAFFMVRVRTGVVQVASLRSVL